VAKLLLEKGADVDSKASDGQTPLSLAAANGHEDVVKLLLENRADVHAQGEAMVRPLLEKGADQSQ